MARPDQPVMLRDDSVESFDFHESAVPIESSQTRRTAAVHFHQLRNSHSCSLLGHDEKLPLMLPVRSTLNLSSRGPAYPVLATDLTYDSVRETVSRRNLHRSVMTVDPNAFRR